MNEPDAIEVRALRPHEVPAAVGVLARGMRDNPLHMAAYGEDPQRRLRCHTRLMRGLFAVFSARSRSVPCGATRSSGVTV